jgi:alkylation response protein AidB-like acyl-CoA dehydrogenase
MPSYTAPMQDMQFVLHQVWDIKQHLAEIPYFENISLDILDTVLEEAAKINNTLLAPLNSPGDQQGCQFNHGKVTTPEGFKNAYQTFQQAGWPALTADPEHGGQGFPETLGILCKEMLSASNTSFSLYVDLTNGVAKCIATHANDALKQTYLPKLVSGEWTGVMCLTEAQSGSDLNLIRTKAEPQADGSYLITGSKIFITAGEHDLSNNIIHVVLARTPDAPEGVKGLSVFIVPKYSVTTDGQLAERNAVYCGSIEHKMGLKASATCVINYENATGYLLGELHKGINAMFTVMNIERLSIGIEGLGLAEVAYQNAAQYAKERLQGHAPGGRRYEDKAADPIIVHPDVRRMLLTMRSYNEGSRALAVWIAREIDKEQFHPEPAIRDRANKLVQLFTPVAKAFFSDYGFDACNLGLQVLGGHGYITEWGMEQFVRDARIAQIYEGTNGIQALDLIKRKLLANQGEYLHIFQNEVHLFIESHRNKNFFTHTIHALEDALHILQNISEWLLAETKQDAALAGSASVDYLHLFAHVALAYMWAKMLLIAQTKHEQNSDSFYTAKIHCGEFYFTKLLPKIYTLQNTIKAGSHSVMSMPDEFF